MTMAQTEHSPGADILVRSLIDVGIRTIFGLPGDSGVVLYDALRNHTDEITYILVRDERHAGYMADAYARSSRRLAACEASSGAGAVYLASGLAEAYAAGIPVLAITSDIHQRSMGSGAITEIDQMALFDGVTKWRRMAERAADIPRLVAEATQAATGGRPGPVALVVPENILDEHVPEFERIGSLAEVPSARPTADHGILSTFATDLATARRPAILAGGGVHMSGAWQQLTELAEHAAIPVATTIHGKGALAEDHPLALGIAGGNGCRGYANEYLEGSDVVLIVGSRANSTDTNGFTTPPRGHVRIGQIDIEPTRAGRNFPGSAALVGDAAIVMRQLRDLLPEVDENDRATRQDGIRRARAQWAHRTIAADLPDLDPGRLPAHEVIGQLYRVFGPQTWVVGDPGTPTPYLAAFWESAGFGWRVIIPRGHGPMGFSMPAAIGVSVAHPGDRVVCLTTESSLAMAVADWETAGRLRLPITFVVLNNVSLGWIKMLQHLYMGGRYFAVDPGPLDPVLLARGMGLTADTARDLEHLTQLAKESAGRDGPTVIHVRVPEHHTLPPPVAPWQAALSGTSNSRPVY
jgi:acetolactate synthase-1/2/3 large subunit